MDGSEVPKELPHKKLSCPMFNGQSRLECVVEGVHAGPRNEYMNTSKPSSSSRSVSSGAQHKEVRCAVRFPLSLPAVLSSGREEHEVLTRNVSASGVLFETHDPHKVGEGIDFSIRMPGDYLGAPSDVLVRCTGRVVRCSVSHGQYQTAATIDEYRFAEQ